MILILNLIDNTCKSGWILLYRQNISECDYLLANFNASVLKLAYKGFRYKGCYDHCIRTVLIYNCSSYVPDKALRQK